MRSGWVAAILALTGLWTLALSAATPPPDGSPPPEAVQPPPADTPAPPPAAPPQAAPAPARPQRQPAARPGRIRPRGAPQRDPRAEDLLRALMNAHGGEEYLRGVQSLFIRSRLVRGQGTEAQETLITQYWKAPNRYRREQDSVAGLHVMSYNGRYAWNDMGQGVTMAPRNAFRDIEDIVRDINEPLSHLDPGNALQFEGEKEVDGRKADLVLITRPSGKMKRLYLDRDTHRVVLREVLLFDEPDQVRARRRLSDYRKVDRTWVAYLEEDLLADFPSRMEIVDFIPNQAIDDRVFDSPVAPFEESKAPPRP